MQQADNSHTGGWREVWRLAMPLILANSFWTLQITIDRVLLAQWDSPAVGAAMAAAMLFWTPLALFQQTAAYATTFVSQYFGAGRNERIGPAVWQSLYFSLVAGVAFTVLVPFAEDIIALGGHSDAVRAMEAEYFVCLCFSALPTLLVASASSFFTGRGDSWTVLLINGVGLTVNAGLDYLWIFGYGGFPEMGMAGAGWATVVGTWVSALLALALMLRPCYRQEFATARGWRLERGLFLRLMRYGLPSGLQWFLDGVAFTLFLFLIGRMGDAELAATSITFTLNMVAFLPMLGIAQAVGVLVGQRLGENQPALAARSTWCGFHMSWIYMGAVSVLYVLTPNLFLAMFANDADPATWNEVQALVPVLLRFVAVYSLFDSMNLVFSFALKGAGDTRFVTLAALGLSWPLMIVPTWFAWKEGWGVTAAWLFASAYIIAVALVFLFRFRGGKWQSMRVIERVAAADDPLLAPPSPVEASS